MYHLNKEIIGNGESITLQNTAQHYLKQFEILGNTKQNGTPSVDAEAPIESVGDNTNLIPTDEQEWEQGTLNEGEIAESTTRIRTVRYCEIDTIEQTISMVNNFNYVYENIYYYKADKTYINNQYILSDNQDTNFTELTFTPPEETKYFKTVIKKNDDSEISEKEIPTIKPKLEKGNKKSAYSPNGQGSITIEDINRNLAKINEVDWEITLNGIKNKNQNSGAYLCEFKLKKGEKVQISLQLFSKPTEDTTLSFYVDGVTDNTYGFIALQKNYMLNDIYTKTYTAKEDCTITYRLWGNPNSDIFEFQFWAEIGHTTRYVVHQSQTQSLYTQQPFTAIGDVRDRFVKQNGKWYEEHNGHKILDGKEEWRGGSYSTNSTKYRYFYTTVERPKGITSTTTILSICNRLKPFTKNQLTSGATEENVIGFALADSNNLRIILDEALLEDTSTTALAISSFKTWLAKNNIEVIYQLLTPTLIPCTAEQVKQLEYFEKEMKSYDEATHINSTDIISPYLNAIAYQKISDEYKARVKSGKITRGYLRILATETLPEIIINENNYLKDLRIEELRYVPEEGFIGGAVAKRLSGNFNNVDSSFNIQDREIEVYLGVELEDKTTEYIKYGTYVVQRPEDDQVNDNTSFEALDYMVKLNKEYVDRVTYPCSVKTLLNDVLDQAGVKSKVYTFDNSEFTVENNQFEPGTTLREVVKAIAQIAFNWARIDEDDNFVMDFEIKQHIDEELGIDDYFSFKKSDDYGPVNVVVLRNSQVEGENVTIKDEESIAEYGETELVISDNPFAYTESKRAILIEAGKRLFGLRYTPMVVDMLGLMYLNAKDIISVQNLNGETFSTYLLDHTIDYTGVVLDSMESKAKTKTETKYQYSAAMKQLLKNTEAIVDKANQEITLIAEKQVGTEQTVSELKVTLEGISSKVATKDDIEERINELEQTIEGTTNRIVTSGGNNVFYYSLEYWEEQETSNTGIKSVYNDEIKQNTSSGYGYLLNKCFSIQKQTVKNGPYTISFAYSKLKQLATGYVLINKQRYDLVSENEGFWYDKTITINVESNQISIELHCDTDGAFYLGDLMVAYGEEKQNWSQNANETVTDTVQIGKGVQVNSTRKNTYTRIDADGNRTYNSVTGNVVAEMTEEGIEGNKLKIKGQAQLNGLLVQTIDNQIWISSIL